jgi:hypothetical protein
MGSFDMGQTWGKMKHDFFILMKRTLNLFLLKNNMSVSLCPRRFCVSHSPICPYNWTTFDYGTAVPLFYLQIILKRLQTALGPKLLQLLQEKTIDIVIVLLK